ncbi:uncharacterized protein LOC106012726 [Aplysia californica]|uniref:Uncharacterized protein LOC106012726 n=1 Tax=Aplysia californica TaxID=6500 RepID=A0ABM1A6U8_APLCA|nr:uncharacterized protein LOC106012726 [Aplysia californica]
MKNAEMKCYSDQGLVLHLPDDPNNPDHIKQTSVANALTSTPEVVCKNRAAYDAAIHCSLALSQSCTPKAYQSLLPDENNLKMVQNIMCNNLNSLNHMCTVNNTHDLVDCGIKKYGTMTVADAMDPYKSTCTAYQHAEECLEEEIQECGQANLDLQKQFNQLSAPVACQGAGTAIGK